MLLFALALQRSAVTSCNLKMQTGLSVSAVELSLAVLFAADCTCVKGIARHSCRKSLICNKSLLVDTVQSPRYLQHGIRRDLHWSRVETLPYRIKKRSLNAEYDSGFYHADFRGNLEAFRHVINDLLRDARCSACNAAAV